MYVSSLVQFIEVTLDDSDAEDEEPADPQRAVKRARRNLDENTIDAIIRVEAKMRDPSSSTSLKSGFKPEERRRQEMHYLQLWKETRAELRSMRKELVGETDPEVIEEVMSDMAGLKKKKDDLAKFLGIETIAEDTDEVEPKMEMQMEMPSMGV